MKAQAVAFLAVMLPAVLFQWQNAWKTRARSLFLGAFGALLAVAALAAATGQLIQFRNGYTLIIAQYPRVTSYAWNLWWLLTRPWHKPPFHGDFPLDHERIWGLVQYRSIGLVLFAAGLLLIIWRLWRA